MIRPEPEIIFTFVQTKRSMKVLYTALLALLLFPSCRRQSGDIDSFLHNAESLMNEHPEDALSIIRHIDQQRIITGLVLLFSLSLLVAGLLYLRKWRENAALKMREAEAEKESLGRACRELQEQLGTVGDRVDTDDEQERQLFDALEERMVVLRNWVDKAETMKPALFMKSFRDYMTVNVKSKHALSDLQYVVNRKYFGVVDYLKVHYPELRKQDLDLCCLLCFGFSQHGICYLYNYEDIGSFYNKRSRLRKKLGLPPERTLESFIAELLAELAPKEE